MADEVKDLTSLPDKEVDTKLNEALSDAPPVEPVIPAKAEPAKADTSPAAQDTPPAKAENKQSTEPPIGDQPLLAGKFETPAMLEKGVNELVKNLKVPFEVKFFVERELKNAQKSKDFKEVEDLYKQLQSEFTRRSEEAKSGRTEDVQVEEQSSEADTEEFRHLTPQEETTWIEGETMRALQSHPIMAELRQSGLDLPLRATPEERNQWITDMKSNYPVLFVDLRNAISGIRQDTKTFLEGVYKEHDEKQKFIQEQLPALTKTAKEKGEQFITEFNKKFPIGLTPEEISSIVEEGIKDPKFMVDQKGLKIPTETSVEDYFLTKVMRQKLSEMTQNAENKGRTQHVEDLKKMEAKILDTASTASLSKRSDRTASTKIDFSKKEDVSLLSDKDLNAEFNKLTE